MFEIYDGRAYFYQWDADMLLKTEGLPLNCDVNFENDKVPSMQTTTYEKDGQIVCEVPDIFLQYPENLRVSSYVEDEYGRRTTYRRTIAVVPKKKPPGYVYTKQELKTYEKLEERIMNALEEDKAKEDERLAEMQRLQEQCESYALLCNQILQECQDLKNEMGGNA